MIRRQPAPPHAPHHARTASEALVSELLGEPTHQAAPHRANRAAKAVGLTTGALVLLAFVVTASILAGTRSGGREQPDAEPPGEITGSSALRPDVLAAELGGVPDAPEPAREPFVPPVADVPVEPPPGTSEVVPPPSVTARAKPRVEAVRQFYDLLPAKPADAVRLLAPELVGESTRDFAASWDGIRAISVDSTVLRPDGSVLAVVSLQEVSGRWMRVEQAFWLTDTSRPRIVGTQVLSAQRS
ncbi:hypothetical protein [Saccharothrix australiensis]|uniref:hypothetical protein n=1 Tax=Saccharothrix australiensis TaxID=2072 RepID=UPI0011C3A972|nr:hypothetical protein [Saccharothrix australiensis]